MGVQVFCTTSWGVVMILPGPDRALILKFGASALSMILRAGGAFFSRIITGMMVYLNAVIFISIIQKL
jgi:hypothetical protein